MPLRLRGAQRYIRYREVKCDRLQSSEMLCRAQGAGCWRIHESDFDHIEQVKREVTGVT